MISKLFIILVLSLFVLVRAEATPDFTNSDNERRYTQLINELRCLVCQNQTIADSNAALAKDLRGEVAAMIQQGKSDEDIVHFLVERYGDFVLYRPPLKASTLLLWTGPALMLLFGVWFLLRRIRKFQQIPQVTIDPDERRKIRQMMESENVDR